MRTTGAWRSGEWRDEMGARKPVLELAERARYARHPVAGGALAAAVFRLGAAARGLAGAGPARLPRSAWRLLGVHRREAPLHSVRHLSVRPALAPRAGDRAADIALGRKRAEAVLELAARHPLGPGPGRHRYPDVGRNCR